MLAKDRFDGLVVTIDQLFRIRTRYDEASVRLRIGLRRLPPKKAAIPLDQLRHRHRLVVDDDLLGRI